MVKKNYAYLINHINILVSKKQRFVKLVFSKKIIRLISALSKYGVLNSFLILCFRKKSVKISPLIYKNKPFFSGLKLVTTSSKCFYIKLKALLLLKKSLGETIILIETPLGILSHEEAIKFRTGGKILCVIN